MEIKPSNSQRGEINPSITGQAGQVKQQEPSKTSLSPEIKKSEPKPPLESTTLSPDAQTLLDNRGKFTDFLNKQGINDINDEKSVKALIENLKKTDPEKSKNLEEIIKKFQAGDITNDEFNKFFKDFGIEQESSLPSLAPFGLGMPMGMPPMPPTPMGAGTTPISPDSLNKVKDIFRKKDSIGAQPGKNSKDSAIPDKIINKDDTNKEALAKVNQNISNLSGELNTKKAELKGDYAKELKAINDGTDVDVKNAVEIKKKEINNNYDQEVEQIKNDYGKDDGETGKIGNQNKTIKDIKNDIEKLRSTPKENLSSHEIQYLEDKISESEKNLKEAEKNKEGLINEKNGRLKEAEKKKNKALQGLETPEGRKNAVNEVVERTKEVQAKIQDLGGKFEHQANAELKDLNNKIKNLESKKAPLEAKVNQGEGDKKVSQDDLQNLGEIAEQAVSGKTSPEKETDNFDLDKLLGILQDIQQLASQSAQIPQGGGINPQSLQPLQNYMNQYGTQMSKDVRGGMEKILKGNMEGLNTAIKSMQEMSKPAKNFAEGLNFNLPDAKLNLANLFAMNGLTKSAPEPGSTLNIVSPPPASQNSQSTPSPPSPPKTA